MYACMYLVTHVEIDLLLKVDLLMSTGDEGAIKTEKKVGRLQIETRS